MTLPAAGPCTRVSIQRHQLEFKIHYADDSVLNHKKLQPQVGGFYGIFINSKPDIYTGSGAVPASGRFSSAAFIISNAIPLQFYVIGGGSLNLILSY